MGCTVRDIYRAIDAFAPFETAMQGDNAGLLIGRMDAPVDTVMTALDATPDVVREAQAVGAQLLVTHHPVMMFPVQRLDEENTEAAVICDIIRAGLSMIAAHTNLDKAKGGVNDVLAQRVGWPVLWTEEFLRAGRFEKPDTLGSLQERVAAALGGQVVRYGPADREISRFAICSGSGGSEVMAAAHMGAQVLLCGEIKHHQALEAMARGVCVLAAGHWETEICAADLLRNHLLSTINKVESKVRVFVSETNPFA